MKGFCLIAVVVAMYFLIRKGKPVIEPTYFRLMQLGLALILFGALLDFADDFSALDNVFILGGRDNILHDFLEDQVGAHQALDEVLDV